MMMIVGFDGASVVRSEIGAETNFMVINFSSAMGI